MKMFLIMIHKGHNYGIVSQNNQAVLSHNYDEVSYYYDLQNHIFIQLWWKRVFVI